MGVEDLPEIRSFQRTTGNWLDLKRPIKASEYATFSLRESSVLEDVNPFADRYTFEPRKFFMSDPLAHWNSGSTNIGSHDPDKVVPVLGIADVPDMDSNGRYNGRKEQLVYIDNTSERSEILAIDLDKIKNYETAISRVNVN